MAAAPSDHVAATWDDATLRITSPPAEPVHTGLPEGVADGDWVSADVLAFDPTLMAGEDEWILPIERRVTGVLTATYVEVLGSWRYSVDGQSVDPSTARPATDPEPAVAASAATLDPVVHHEAVDTATFFTSTGTSAWITALPDDAEAFALEGGEPAAELHVTLVYLVDDAGTLDDSAKAALADLTRAAAAARPGPAEATIGSIEPLGDDGAVVAMLDGGAIFDLQADIRLLLDEYAPGVFPPKFDSFTPHMTLAYVPEGAPADAQQKWIDEAQHLVGRTVICSEVAFCEGVNVHPFPIGPRAADATPKHTEEPDVATTAPAIRFDKSSGRFVPGDPAEPAAPPEPAGAVGLGQRLTDADEAGIAADAQTFLPTDGGYSAGATLDGAGGVNIGFDHDSGCATDLNVVTNTTDGTLEATIDDASADSTLVGTPEWQPTHDAAVAYAADNNVLVTADNAQGAEPAAPDAAPMATAGNVHATQAARATDADREAAATFEADPSGAWEGVLVVEGADSGDGRRINPEALTWRDLPLPLMCMFRNADGGDGHAAAELVGRIDAVERRDGGQVWGKGVLDVGGEHGAEAYRLLDAQFLRGVSVDLDMLEVTFEGQADEPTDPLEALFGDPGTMVVTTGRIMGACYDDLTEVLTEHRGFVRFAELDESDRVATRDKVGRFEWQLPTGYTNDPWNGPMIRFTSGGVQTKRRGRAAVQPTHRSLDLLVTPNHRMLVRSTKTGLPMVMRADELAAKSARSYSFLATSEWDAPDVDTVVLRPDPVVDGECGCGCGRELPAAGSALRLQGHNRSTEPLTMDGDIFAAFMGAWLSEGSILQGPGGAPKGAHISQLPASKGHALFSTLVAAMGGAERGGGFRISNVRLARWLSQFGTARNKFIPPEISEMSARQLRIFLDHFIAGDGDVEGRNIYTSSRRMAGDLQAVAQKLGMWAPVGERIKPDQDFEGRVISASGPGYVVALRNRPGSRSAATICDWKARRVEDHEGMVRCVTVPNEILYVRRNGIPAWCGNTLTPMPAFQEARIMLVQDAPAGAALPAEGQATVERIPRIDHAAEVPCPCKQGQHATGADDCGCAEPAVLVAAAGPPMMGARVRTWLPFEGRRALVASAAGDGFPVHPPMAWFQAPDVAPDAYPVRIHADGRISGYAAEWGSCHIGARDCVTPPRSATGYRRFRTGQVLTAEGNMVATGPIVMNTVHPDLMARASDAQAFYAHTGCVAGDVAVYENEVGIYVTGAARPGLTPAEVRTFNASDGVSPDWRPVAGKPREMVALVMVNNSGFKVEPALVASAGGVHAIPPGRIAAREVNGEIVALVAAGAVLRQSPAKARYANLEARLATLEASMRPIRLERARARATAGRKA